MFREEGRPQPGDCGHLARVWNALRPCLSGRRSPCAGKLADPAARHLSGYKGPTSYPPTLGIDNHRLCSRSRDRESKGRQSEGSVTEKQASQTKLDEVVHIPRMPPCASAEVPTVRR